MRSGWLWVSFAILVPEIAFAGLAPKRHDPPPNSILPMGRSIGSPTDGKLLGGAHLEETPYLRIVPAYAAGDVRWGLGSLVGMLDRSARAVRRQFPDATLSVGHLSRAGGGDLDRHASHESGRDADVAFYVKDARGKPLYADHLVSFTGDGQARTWPGATFDDARNWALVAALLSDPVAHVSHIFISAPLRARLLAYAARIGAPPALQTRAALTMAQPFGSLPHDDHFHVRISCPPGMQGCIENPTVARRPKPRKITPRPGVAPAVDPPKNKAPAPAKDMTKGSVDATDERKDDIAPAATIDVIDGT
jgi:penicillin-insensitive murein endopeptidase